MKALARSVFLFVLPALMTIAGCGTGPANTSAGTSNPAPVTSCVTATAPEFAYLLNDNTLSMYTVNSCTGQLSPISPGTIATGANPEEMVVDPLGRFAYVANLVSNAQDLATISMYTIDSATGVLTPTSPATVPTGFFPQGITIDPSGRFVYTANSDDNSISMFTINPATGVLTPMQPASVASGSSPDGITVDPTGHYAYAANQDDNTVSMYTISQTTGVLTPMATPTVRTGNSPFGVFIDPGGKFAYVANAYPFNNADGISQYTIDAATGTLVPDAAPTAAAGNDPTAIAIDPTSRFAYVTNRQDNTVGMYSIDATTGMLTSIATPVASGSMPFRLTFDPSGQFLYVVNEGAPASVFTVNRDGSLQAAGAVETGTNAVSMGLARVRTTQ